VHVFDADNEEFEENKIVVPLKSVGKNKNNTMF
jgi:hypothetical protein